MTRVSIPRIKQYAGTCTSTAFGVDVLIRFPLPVRMAYLSLALVHVIFSKILLVGSS